MGRHVAGLHPGRRRGLCRAREALARADALDPNPAESHVVRHMLLMSSLSGYQLLAAFDALKAAQALNPNIADYELGSF